MQRVSDLLFALWVWFGLTPLQWNILAAALVSGGVISLIVLFMTRKE